jgi:hypothetical protein
MNAFYPNTFMYYEEHFLMHLLKIENGISIYSPLLKVHHKVNKSTDLWKRNQREKIVFKETTAIHSAKYLINFIKMNDANSFNEMKTDCIYIKP